jgi:hypothetical protein
MTEQSVNNQPILIWLSAIPQVQAPTDVQQQAGERQ